MAKRDDQIVFSRAPSVDAVLTWVSKLGDVEYRDGFMSGEDAHRAAAVFLAANTALRLDLLGKSWKGNRHLAAKCGELFDRVCSMPAYRTANRQFEVSFPFAEASRRPSRAAA